MSSLSILNFKGAAVRAVTIDGEPWWVARDVCAILGLANSRQVLTRLDDKVSYVLRELMRAYVDGRLVITPRAIEIQ